MRRLKRLAGCLLLRRPKKTIQLPTRHDEIVYVDFQNDERKLYEEIRNQTIERLEEALMEGRRGSSSGSYISVLQQIEAMRMVCNLGLLFPSRHDASLMTGKKPNIESWDEIAQGAFNLRLGMGSIQCIFCAFSLDATNNPLDDSETSRAFFTECLRFVCSSCEERVSLNAAGQLVLGCCNEPLCCVAPVAISAASLETPPVPLSIGGFATTTYLPTKVTTLVADLKMRSPDVKRYGTPTVKD